MIYLKANSKEALWESLCQAGLYEKDYDPKDELNVPNGEEDWVPTGSFEYRKLIMDLRIDEVGIIKRPTGNIISDDAGREFPEYEILEGWHANIMGPVTREQLDLLPTIRPPKKPHRKWAS